jgi:hypothetical protein
MRLRILAAALVLAAGAGPSLAADKQFEGHCAMSVAAGTPVPTDCSVYWISPDDKLYCFSSVASRDAFLANEPRNEKLADAFWRDPAFWEKLKNEQQ